MTVAPKHWKHSFEQMRLRSEMIREQIEQEAQSDGTTVLSAEEHEAAKRFAAFKSGRFMIDKLDEDKRATKIRKLNIKASINPKSTETIIVQVLKANPAGLHINQIIDELNKLGCTSKSAYHRYSHISSILNKNYLLFDKIGKATFKLKEVVVPEKKELAKQPIEPKAKPPSIKEMVLWAKKKYGEKYGDNPKQIADMLNFMEVECSYSTVSKALRGK